MDYGGILYCYMICTLYGKGGSDCSYGRKMPEKWMVADEEKKLWKNGWPLAEDMDGG